MKYILIIALLFLGGIINAQTYVKGYTKKNGTYVEPHYRSSPNSTKSDNYSTKGNYNPYTGKSGTKTDDSYNSGSYITPSYNYNSVQSPYADWTSYTIDEFYEKIDLPQGTIDASGRSLSYLYIKTDAPKTGVYSVSISDSDDDLYEIKGTSLFVKFTGYHGYAGYSEDGVLSVKSVSYSVYYKKP